MAPAEDVKGGTASPRKSSSTPRGASPGLLGVPAIVNVLPAVINPMGTVAYIELSVRLVNVEEPPGAFFSSSFCHAPCRQNRIVQTGGRLPHHCAPEPVWPYAKMHTLKPSTALRTRCFVSSNTCGVRVPSAHSPVIGGGSAPAVL